MKFEDAIDAHLAWKARLRKLIAGVSTETLDPTVVERDNQCALGKWIYGDAVTMRSEATYQRLVEQHATFHRNAAEIVRSVAVGDTDRAKSLLDGDAYKQGSRSVIRSIVDMRNRSQKG